MPLFRLDNVSLAYGHLPLLAQVNLEIEPGERICLVGRNGTGKTTLLRVITGAAPPDEGEIWRRETLRIGHLEQGVSPDTDQTIFQAVAAGLGELGNLLTEYHQIQIPQAAAAGQSSLEKMANLHSRIDMLDGWNVTQKVETILSRLALPAGQRLCDARDTMRDVS